MKNVKKISCNTEWKYQGTVSIQQEITNITVTFDDGTAKYIEMTHPLTNEALASGFRLFAEDITKNE